MSAPNHTYAIPMRTRFRGLTVREGMVWRGPAGWAEWSPFREYGVAESAAWLRAADEAAEVGWPAPVRDHVEVNVTVPAEAPEAAYARVRASGCRTAKVKVAEPGQPPEADEARVEAVRAALGSSGRVRVDANGAWDVETAERTLARLARHDLEYAEQPCATVAELADLRLRLARRGVDVPIAADESIRRADDPLRVVRAGAADVAVLKVQPLGGVTACLRIAEQLGLPVVVSSALETSVGIRAGLALAAALPELPYACGLNTVPLLRDDLAVAPLVAVDGRLPVGALEVDDEALARCTADPATDRLWQARLVAVREQARGERRG